MLKLRPRGACPPLAQTVAFAFCDLAGAGPRALLALEPPPGCSMRACEVDIDGLPAAARAFATGAARSAPAELIAFLGEDGAPRASLLLLLAPVPEERHTAVAAAVFEFVKQAPGGLSRFVVAAAMRMPPPADADAGVRAVALHGAPDLGLPGLPADTPLSDGLLASLLHFCRAGGAPTLALLAPGFRVRLPGSAVDNEAVAVACRLAAAACSALGCSFSPDAAKVRAKLVPWHSTADADAGVMMYT